MTPSVARAERFRIAVFAKAPVPGAVKTRLAPLLGADGAAALHAGLLRHALGAATASDVGSVELWCAPDERHSFFERCATEFAVRLRRQEGADLGSRMRHAFEDAFSAGDALIVIGSDCPVLGAAELRGAAEALRRHDAVIAPAEDGGYVLVGLVRSIPQLFEGIAWGGSAVMGQTRARLGELRIEWKELATSWDVYRPEDYSRLQREGLLEEVMS